MKTPKDDELLIRALWRYKRKSSLSGAWVIDGAKFNLVQQAAGLSKSQFYFQLRALEGEKFLRCARKRKNNKMLYIVLRENFPVPEDCSG